jgi:hypothetical protein
MDFVSAVARVGFEAGKLRRLGGSRVAAICATKIGVQFSLEDLLGRPVALVTDKALRPELRPFIEQEAVHV